MVSRPFPEPWAFAQPNPCSSIEEPSAELMDTPTAEAVEIPVAQTIEAPSDEAPNIAAENTRDALINHPAEIVSKESTAHKSQAETPAIDTPAASDGQRASNDPRLSKRSAATAEIATTTMEIHVSQPLVADAASLPEKGVSRASNDPRAKRHETTEDSQEETI